MSPQVWPPVPPQKGRVAGIGTTLVPVTFATPFSAVPFVQATVTFFPGANAAAAVSHVTPTGFSVCVTTGSGATVDWQASL